MANEFKVLKVDQLTRVSDTKGLEPYFRVQLKTKGGIVLTVDIDEDDYTEAKAAPILLEKAKNADAILKLTG